MRFSFRGKILLYTSALLITLLGTLLVFVNFQAQRFSNERVASTLEAGRQRIQVIHSERISALRLAAQNVASFPGLKAALDETDAATVRDLLLAYREQVERTDLLMALDLKGRVIARTDTADPTAISSADKWAQEALANRITTGLLSSQNNDYDVAVAPATSAGIVFGFVLAGARLDSGYAANLKAVSGVEIIIAGEKVLGTTIREPDLPWQSREDWGSVVSNANRLQTVEVSGESYAALPFFIGEGESRLLAVMLQSRDSALAPYRSIRLGIIVVGLVILIVGVVASTFLSRSVSTGVSRLEAATERVARGDFRTTIEVEKSDATEISNLARSFNEMTRGLRERADMQKFISQSTVDMIRARGGEKMAAGGRVDMTLFFSDIRGFTVMSEKLPPEDVVFILNECLSLQAGIVQKYEGDIDKYMGDCVMAHFYEPNSTSQAVQCAIEIEKAMQKMNERVPEGERIEVGIGIARGEAILGSIGSENRRDFTAVGSIVNLCSRLCSMAGPSEILLSELAYKAVENSVPAEKLDPLTVKGFSKPIPVYRIAVKARASA